MQGIFYLSKLNKSGGMSGNELYDIIHEIWDNGHDTLGEMLDEETTDKIMLESENYILGK